MLLRVLLNMLLLKILRFLSGGLFLNCHLGHILNSNIINFLIDVVDAHKLHMVCRDRSHRFSSFLYDWLILYIH